MSLSVDSPSCVLPGFRFQPTEQELLGYYLKKKVAYEWIDLNFIQEVDLNNFEYWDLKGFWKATGRDKVIYNNLQKIGLRKTLVFYKGRAPNGQNSDWIMHEYRLHNDDNNSNTTSDTTVSDFTGGIIQEDIWVVCRVFEKKDRHKLLDTPSSSSDKIVQFSGSCMNELDGWDATFGGDLLLQSPTAPIVEIEQLDGFSDWVTADSFSELPHDPNSTHRTHVHHLFGYM